jgi:ribosome-associated protein
MDIPAESLLPNISFRTSRSGGPGGQNVNKVGSRVELRFNFSRSETLTDDQKKLISNKLQKHLTDDNRIQVFSQESRSQLQNKEIALNKLQNLLKNALTVQKPRKPTRPGRKAVEKRLESKKIQALKKMHRKRNWD